MWKAILKKALLWLAAQGYAWAKRRLEAMRKADSGQ